MYALGVSILPLSTILIFDFGIFPTLRYFCFSFDIKHDHIYFIYSYDIVRLKSHQNILVNCVDLLWHLERLLESVG